MIKGLFGKKPQYGAMMPGYSMPQDMAMQDGASLMQQASVQRPLSFFQGGDKFTGRDAIAGILAAVGDAVSNEAGGGTGAVAGLMQARMRPMQEAAALAAAQRQQAMELAQYRAKKGIDAEFDRPDAPKPGSFEWYQTATPEQRAAYDQYNPVVTTTYQGPTIVPRSSLGGVPSAPVGKLTPIAQPQAPAQPISGARSITGQEYNRILQSMGGDQRRMNAWMASQNVIVGN